MAEPNRPGDSHEEETLWAVALHLVPKPPMEKPLDELPTGDPLCTGDQLEAMKEGGLSTAAIQRACNP